MQAASAFSLSAAGIGVDLMTSTHTCFAAARAPARSPSAALLQMPSSLLFRLASRVGSCVMIDLQASSYSAAVAPGTVPAAGCVGVVLAGEVDDFGAVAGVVAAALEVFAGVVVVVELVVLELLLPHPAISAPQSSVTASFENRPAVTFSPFDLLSAQSSLLDGDRYAWLGQG